jgi:hypothetical protein
MLGEGDDSGGGEKSGVTQISVTTNVPALKIAAAGPIATAWTSDNPCTSVSRKSWLHALDVS